MRQPDNTKLLLTRLRFAIRWSGMTRSQFTRAVGESPRKLLAKLADRRTHDELLPRIAALVKVPTDWLIRGGDPSRRPDSATWSAMAPGCRAQRKPSTIRPPPFDLPIASWTEALVLWRLLEQQADDTHDLPSVDAARQLMRRLVDKVGMDAKRLGAGARAIAPSLSGDGTEMIACDTPLQS